MNHIMAPIEYAELLCTSNFSLLSGASHPEELVHTAHFLGYEALSITDHNTLAGIVRGHVAAKHLNFKFHVGCRVRIKYEENLPSTEPEATLDLALYPTTRESYGKLCRLLSIGKLRTEKGGCLLTLNDFYEHHRDLAIVIIPPYFGNDYNNAAIFNLSEICKQIKDSVADPALISIAITRNYSHNNSYYLNSIIQIAQQVGFPLVASNDAYYHSPERRPIYDVLTCIKEKCTVQQAGFKLFQNAERYLKPLQEIKRLYRELPQALTRTVEISRMLNSFSLDQLRYEYPYESPPGMNPLRHLTELTWQGAAQRYPHGVPLKVKELIDDELRLIHELEYEKYFITCYEIVSFARRSGILCQGRGAAANSAVCYCLGITSVDPDKIDLLFARFVSKERNEPPDIDIDFEHERREEVIQYIYQRYGREHAGLTCNVVTYQPRSTVRDVGKALGLSLEIVDRLAKSIHRWTACELSRERLLEIGIDPDDVTIQNTLSITQTLLDFPRHLSQHVGGFIISQTPLCETVPILNAAMPERTIIEWNKDDIDALGLLKIDVLGLGMLSCVRKALLMINKERLHENKAELEMHSIPAEDPAVYDMVCAADTIGVFQIESRAQMSMLPRLKPRCFYDLVIEVAIVRPGPIQGDMVHPFLKRRNGLEPVSFPDERVRGVLGKTLGVPIFQEQAMRLAITLANFTPDEAEKLRRAIGAWRCNKDIIARFKERIVKGMTANGYSEKYAETCMHQIRGFSEYGFPESHAASFALIVYASAWIKCHYPAHFAAALINSQPMGFYAPAQIVQDAKNHGIDILAIDVNYSDWDCSVDNSLNDEGKRSYSLRLGMRLIRGLSEEQARLIVSAVRSYGKVTSVRELWLRSHMQNQRLRLKTLKALAAADAFSSLGLSRREAFWQIQALPPEPLPLDKLDKMSEGAKTALPETTTQQEMFDDYNAIGLSLRAHPLQFIRDSLNARLVQTASMLKALAKKPRHKGSFHNRAAIAGIAILRQRPGTAKGVVFITLEDETGIVNLIIKPRVFERYSRLVLSSSCMLAHGTLQHVGDIPYVDVDRLQSLDREILEDKKSALPNRSFSY